MKNIALKLAALILLISQVTFANEILVKVPKVVCSSCSQKITEALKDIPAIEKIDVDVKTKIVKIKTKDKQDISDDVIRKAIEEKAKFNVETITRT